MTEREHACFSAGSGFDERTHANQLHHSGASTLANTSIVSEEDAHQGASPLVLARELIAGQQRPVDLRPQEKNDRHSSGPRLRLDAGSSRKKHGAHTIATPQSPSPQQGETETVLTSSIEGPPPGPLVQEIVNEKAAHLIGGIATPSRQRSELGIAVCASSSKEVSPAVVSYVADIEEDGHYRDEHEHSEGSDGSASQDFEYGGENEERSEAAESSEATERPEKNMQRKEDGQEACEDVAQESKQADADEEEKCGVASAGTTTQSVPCDNRSSPHVAQQEALADTSTPAGGEAQALEQPPHDENLQQAHAAAPSQQQDSLEPKEHGEEHDPAQAPHSPLMPAGWSTEMTSNTRVVTSSTAKPLPGTVPNAAATDDPNGENVVEVAAGYVRRPSYVAGQAMRPGRSAARASVQHSLPPVSESGPETDSTRAASNAAAEVEPEESGQLAGDQSWAEYHARNAKRQHSTPNLVSFRRNPQRQLVELFEEDDSDDGSTSSHSSGDVGEKSVVSSVEDRQTKLDSWQQSEEGISRMAQLTKATVAVESTAAKMSAKYLKLFAPSNSVSEPRVFARVSLSIPTEKTNLRVTQS